MSTTHTYAIDASDLGLPPGRFPTTVTYLGLGFDRPVRLTDGEGDLVGYRYSASALGCTLTVYND
jgi:hypothetical protein